MPSLWTSSLVASSARSAYWDGVSFISGTTKTYLDPASVGGSMMTLVFARTPPGTLRDDVMELSLHWAVEAGPGAPCVALTGSQAASIETIMATWWTTMKASVISTVQLREYQWRDYRADFPVGKDGQTIKYSPTWRTTSVVSNGTAAGSELPHQVAETCTLTTASRKHWGRFYMTGLSSSHLNSPGRLTNAYVDLLATATRTAFNSAAALPAITNPWVWSARYGGAMSIREIHCDDIPDIQRRRRDKQVNYRKSFTS